MMAQKATVITHLGIAVRVRTEEKKEEFLPISTQDQLVVGDLVELQNGKIHRLARRNILQRSTIKKGNQVLAANLDSVAIVICTRPETTRVFLEQAVIAIKVGGIEPLIVVNKGELPENQELYARVMREYHGLIHCLLVSARGGLGMDDLRAHIRRSGRCLLAGVSGVGKSSLTNALHLQAELLTGGLSGKTGKHTTSNSTLHVLQSGGELIDSPGVRNFTPINLSIQDLANHFTGFASLIGVGCKFRNCRHVDEPECAIKKAVESKLLSKARYQLYLDMIKSV